MGVFKEAAEGAGGGSALFADPNFWLNLGTAGAFLFLFVMGKIHPQSTIDRLEKQVDRLIAERNRALAERDEMIEVIKEFTQTASTILKVETQSRRQPAKHRPPATTAGGEQ